MKILWIILAIVFSFLTSGAINETHRVFTSEEVDIVTNREQLKPIAIAFTALVTGLAVLFWILAFRARRRKE